MNKIETKILNCSAVREAERNMVFAARLTVEGCINNISYSSYDTLNSCIQNDAAEYSLGSDNTGVVRISSGTPNSFASFFIVASLGVRSPDSYCAIRISAQLSEKPINIPSCFCVR